MLTQNQPDKAICLICSDFDRLHSTVADKAKTDGMSFEPMTTNPLELIEMLKTASYVDNSSRFVLSSVRKLHGNEHSQMHAFTRRFEGIVHSS